MAESENENGFDRLDRKIGMTYSRVMTWVFLIPAALIIGVNTLNSENFTIATHWPGLAATAALVALARYCYRSREGMLSILSDVGIEKSGKHRRP